MELEEFYKLCIRRARWKLGDEAEDFAGWICMQRLEGKARFQSLNQSIVDYLRACHGDTRDIKGLSKAQGRSRTVPITPRTDEDKLTLDIERSLAFNQGEISKPYKPHVKLDELLNGADLKLYKMYCVQELSQKQIAQKLGVTPQYVNAELKRLVKRARKRCKGL